MFYDKLIPLTIELIVGFIILLIGIKIIGKRQVAQITPFDFISAIVLGELLGNAIYDKDITIFHVIYAIAIWTILLYLIEKLTQKSIIIRKAIQGTPVFVIYEGNIEYEVLMKEGLDINELSLLLRQKNVFSVKEIEYAILETNGEISIIKKAEFQDNYNSLHLTLIFEGKIYNNNLKFTKHNKQWLLDKLHQYNINDINDVLFAEWSIIDDDLYIQMFKKTGK